MPPMLWMIWYSEGIGGHSIDRRQIAIVFFTNAALIGLWLLLASYVLRGLFRTISSSGNQIHPYHKTQDPCCFPYLEKGSRKNLSGVVYNGNFVVNETSKKLVLDESKYKPVCVCPLSALDVLAPSHLSRNSRYSRPALAVAQAEGMVFMISVCQCLWEL